MIKEVLLSQNTLKDEIIGWIILTPLIIWGAPKAMEYAYNSVKTALVTELHKGINVDLEKFHSRLTGKPPPF